MALFNDADFTEAWNNNPCPDYFRSVPENDFASQVNKLKFGDSPTPNAKAFIIYNPWSFFENIDSMGLTPLFHHVPAKRGDGKGGFWTLAFQVTQSLYARDRGQLLILTFVLPGGAALQAYEKDGEQQRLYYNGSSMTNECFTTVPSAVEAEAYINIMNAFMAYVCSVWAKTDGVTALRMKGSKGYDTPHDVSYAKKTGNAKERSTSMGFRFAKGLKKQNPRDSADEEWKHWQSPKAFLSYFEAMSIGEQHAKFAYRFGLLYCMSKTDDPSFCDVGLNLEMTFPVTSFVQPPKSKKRKLLVDVPAVSEVTGDDSEEAPATQAMVVEDENSLLAEGDAK